MTNDDPNQQVAQQNPNENEVPETDEQGKEKPKGQPASQRNVTIPQEDDQNAKDDQ